MFTTENSKAALQRFSKKIEENKAYLSELDTPIGDGDHGNNMSRGMAAVIESLEAKHPESVQDVFKLTAMALISKVGGASGPLYGTAMLEIAKAAADSAEPAVLLEAGLAGIKKRGNSDLGEKTMIDLWQPAIEMVKEGRLTEKFLISTTEATKDLAATKGRASYVGERSVGHIDPGAMSSKYFFETLMEEGVFDE